jgi:hypothetical protein
MSIICGGILFHAVFRVPHSKREKVIRRGFSLARIFSQVDCLAGINPPGNAFSLGRAADELSRVSWRAQYQPAGRTRSIPDSWWKE